MPGCKSIQHCVSTADLRLPCNSPQSACQSRCDHHDHRLHAKQCICSVQGVGRTAEAGVSAAWRPATGGEGRATCRRRPSARWRTIRRSSRGGALRRASRAAAAAVCVCAATTRLPSSRRSATATGSAAAAGSGSGVWCCRGGAAPCQRCVSAAARRAACSPGHHSAGARLPPRASRPGACAPLPLSPSPCYSVVIAL